MRHINTPGSKHYSNNNKNYRVEMRDVLFDQLFTFMN